jgi:hypothetical protein
MDVVALSCEPGEAFVILGTPRDVRLEPWISTRVTFHNSGAYGIRSFPTVPVKASHVILVIAMADNERLTAKQVVADQRLARGQLQHDESRTLME